MAIIQTKKNEDNYYWHWENKSKEGSRYPYFSSKFEYSSNTLKAQCGYGYPYFFQVEYSLPLFEPVFWVLSEKYPYWPYPYWPECVYLQRTLLRVISLVPYLCNQFLWDHFSLPINCVQTLPNKPVSLNLFLTNVCNNISAHLTS